jgi:pimeloyl-ACP methyl ester carboxylesterase
MMLLRPTFAQMRGLGFFTARACLYLLLLTSAARARGGKPAVVTGPPAPDLVPPIDTRFVEVRPALKEAFTFQRSRGQTRAVVLVHGLMPHPFSNDGVNKAAFRDWQKVGSPLVETFARDADVFAFAYSQNVAVNQVADAAGLEINIWRLSQLGYMEIVLVGHSAGGLIARQFVEDHPVSGVTKVIQVCAPNAGSSTAKIEAGVRKSQRVFLASLTKEARSDFLAKRTDKKIPASVQFICVVGDAAGTGDYLVANSSQWSRDLQEQGIPAFPLRTTHFLVMRRKADAEKMAELIRDKQPRWDAEKVAATRKDLCKD